MTQRELQGILAWSGLPWVGERTLLALLDHAREGRRSLADLWESPLEDLHALVSLHPKSRAALEQDAAAHWRRAGSEAETLLSWGVDLLVAGGPDYPRALHGFRRKWPLLFAYGALGLLEERRVALVNSRTVSNAALAATDALADALARRDVPLVTSTNKEAYKASATAAKRHAGPSLMVLDRGIAEAFPTGIQRDPVAPARVWDESFDPDLQLLLTAMGWRGRWNQRSSALRDALVIDLADVVVALDVRPGGNMERECLRAAREGKAVVAVTWDRGGGAAPDWEAEPEVRRLPWRGGDEMANALLGLLPGEQPEAAEERSRTGWLREIGHFLARACRELSGSRPGFVSAYPLEGPLSAVAAGWSLGEETGSGSSWLLADLSASRSSGIASQLLQRVALGGLLAAVAPTEWLDGEEHADARKRWLRSAQLLLAVRLPRPAPEHAGRTLAAIVLQREGAANRSALTFAPQQERMGRFHLRRYLHEVLRTL